MLEIFTLKKRSKESWIERSGMVFFLRGRSMDKSLNCSRLVTTSPQLQHRTGVTTQILARSTNTDPKAPRGHRIDEKTQRGDRPHPLQVIVCCTSNSMLATTGQVKMWEVSASSAGSALIAVASWPGSDAPEGGGAAPFDQLLLIFSTSSFNWSRHWLRNSCAS